MFDEKVEAHVNDIIARLQNMGIKNVKKTDALRFIIEMNKAVQLKAKRTKFGFIFK